MYPRPHVRFKPGTMIGEIAKRLQTGEPVSFDDLGTVTSRSQTVRKLRDEYEWDIIHRGKGVYQLNKKV